MKNLFVRIILILSALSLIGCTGSHKNTVTQISTIDAILAGAYDGCTTLRDLSEYGDFGIGTLESLDGEMVLLDGCYYQVKADGTVCRPDRNALTPFASVVFFESERMTDLPDRADYDTLKRIIDREAPNMNLFCAVKVTGTFAAVKTRSVPAQHKPYPPLVEVTRHQSVFDLTDVTGTIVGFRLPPYVKGINVPGYHLHFISRNGSMGGHLLDFTLKEGTAHIDTCARFFMILPDGKGDFGRIDFSRDRTGELQEAEN